MRLLLTVFPEGDEESAAKRPRLRAPLAGSQIKRSF